MKTTDDDLRVVELLCEDALSMDDACAYTGIERERVRRLWRAGYLIVEASSDGLLYRTSHKGRTMLKRIAEERAVAGA